jgi:murein DD-endopeptidase MepM/ murein hydrolase activator NlpD
VCWGLTSNAEAVIERIYTLPFRGLYVGTWFCGYGGHEGTDYVLGDGASGGHPVLAAARGSVWLYEQFPSGAGYYIVMNHDNGHNSHRARYLHLSSRVVVNGQMVARGQVIGYEGMRDATIITSRPDMALTVWPHARTAQR